MDALTSFIVVIIAITIQFSLYAIKRLQEPLEPSYLIDKNTKVFVHRITCNGRKVVDRKVLYPFITVNGSKKAFYVYEGAIITLKFRERIIK